MKRIVAEVTKNWGGLDIGQKPNISVQFEQVIAHNVERGYALESWQLHQLAYPDAQRGGAAMIVETIVAVFVECVEAS